MRRGIQQGRLQVEWKQAKEGDAAKDDEVEAQAEWGPKIAKEEEEMCGLRE